MLCRLGIVKMADFLSNYLGYLRDCARLAARQSSVDFLKSKGSELHCLDGGDIRALSTTQAIESNDELLQRWRRQHAMSAEDECNILLGFGVVSGVHHKEKICCPLIICDVDVSSGSDNTARFAIRQGSFRTYTPLLYKLINTGTNDSLDFVTSELDRLSEDCPMRFPFDKDGDYDKLIESIRNTVPASLRILFSELNRKFTESFEHVLNANIKNSILVFESTIIAIKADSLASFTVEKEISEILKRSDKSDTALAFLQPQKEKEINQKSNNQSSANIKKSLTPDFNVLEVLTLSERQRKCIQQALANDLTVIEGPPGTGKSHTIASLAMNLAYNDKTVLVTSKTPEAVSVVVEKLRKLGGEYVVAHVGDGPQKKEFSRLLYGITGQNTLNPVKTKTELSNLKSQLRLIKREKEELKHEINRQYNVYKRFHEALTNLDKLSGIDDPPPTMSKDTAKRLFDNMGWCARIIDRPRTRFLDKIRIRTLASDAIQSFGGSIKMDFCTLAQRSEKAFHLRSKEDLVPVLNSMKNLRILWERHTEKVISEESTSQEVFNCWRRKQMAELLFSEYGHRQKIIQYAKALETPITNAKKKEIVQKLLDGIEPTLLLSCFPIWACTSAHLSQALRLESFLFDYVIIDEASLCDPATAIPALYRAKRAVIVGDRKQLTHRVPRNISEDKLNEKAAANTLSSVDIQTYGYRQSVLMIADALAPQKSFQMLDEHFRSLPHIISFSNCKFYGNQLKVMRRSPLNDASGEIVFRHVIGRRNSDGAIKAEYDLALEYVMNEFKDNIRRTVGILTMTEAQATYMTIKFSQDLYNAGLDSSEINLKVGTPHAFQGDQRKLIILCLGLESESHWMSERFAMDDNRFNVAVTRAEDDMIIITALDKSEFRKILREYHDHKHGVVDDVAACDSGLEREVYEELISAGYKVIPQFKTCGYRLDFAVSKGDRFIAVEVDGPHHFDDHGQLSEGDIERALRLMRAGWKIERISFYDWEKGIDAQIAFLDRVEVALKE